MARRIRHCSTLPSQLSCLKEFPVRPAQSCCFKNGSTKRRSGKLCRSSSRNASCKNKPSDSHVARTDQDEFGKIFRRNMPYGRVDDHGTVFVGFSADQKRLSRMLDS